MSENESIFLRSMDNEFKPNREKTEEGYFNEEDYKELEDNIIAYKQGNREASTYIIRTFHPFITKYARFICNGDLPYMIYNNDKHDYKKISPTISKFASLFIIQTDEELSKKKLFSNACIRIRTLFSKYEYEDIYNELVLALLNMANKYKVIVDKNDPHYKKNGTFHMYVSKCFHWEAFRFLKKLIQDPLTHNDAACIRDYDELTDEERMSGDFVYALADERVEFQFEEMMATMNRDYLIQHSKKLTIKENEHISAYDKKSINFNWTNGITCSEVFKTLSPYERELIMYSFVQKKTENEIAAIYGCHRTTINVHKRKAITKILENAKRLNLIKL